MLWMAAVFLIIFFIATAIMTWFIAISMLYNNITIEAIFTIIFSITCVLIATYIVHILGYI